MIINRSTKILNVRIDAVNMDETINRIDEWITKRTGEYICHIAAHSIMETNNDSSLLAVFNNSGLSTADGMAIVWLLRLKKFSNIERVYGPDLLQAACSFGVNKGWVHYLYGGKVGVADKLASSLGEFYPDLIIAGTYSPPFRKLSDEEDKKICEQINQSKADILWVGLGSPKQEKWMFDHRREIKVPVMIGVGAAFDFLSGSNRHAPRWIQRSGFEWLFRLFNEPKRLWRRYIQYPKFVYLVIREIIDSQAG